jgi:RNA polymerase sigma-70 factor, ECF subfamily
MAAATTTFQALGPEISHSSIAELEHLVSHELPKFYSRAYRQLGNLHDAEDAVQDALLSAYKNLHQFRGNARLSTWFMSIVLNAARMQRRRRRPLVSLDEQLSSTDEDVTLLETLENGLPGPEEICAKTELRNLVSKAVNNLSPALRRAFRLCYVDGMSMAEVSEALGISGGAVKAQISRARANLTKLLARELRKPRPIRHFKKID